MSKAVTGKVDEMMGLGDDEVDGYDVAVEGPDGSEETWSTLAVYAQLALMDQMNSDGEPQLRMDEDGGFDLDELGTTDDPLYH
jgi:hypothetical protein